MLKQWRLKPFLFCVLVLSNIFFLIVMTGAIYFSVSYLFTKQISEARLEVLYSNQLKLIERLEDIEGTALSISTHPTTKEVLDNTDSLDLYEYINEQRVVSEYLSAFTYIKPFINSIQIYTDRFTEFQKIGNVSKNLVLPLSKITWQEKMPLFHHVDAIWIPSHADAYTDNKPVLTYVLKIYNRKGGVSGYVAVNMNEDSLTRLFFSQTKEASPKNRSLMLLNANNERMSRMSAQVNSQLMDTFEPFVESIHPQDEAGFQPIQVNDNGYLMIYSPRIDNKWRMVEFLETKDIYRDVNTIRNMMLLIGIIVLLFVFPVSSYLSSRIIRPVPILLKGFQRIENGNFETTVEHHSIVEFNKLTHGFNNMAQQLQQMLKELDHKNRMKRDLELTVLQSQINPHFLYNTLDMINWAAAMKGNTEISIMVTQLARLFRISLSKGSTFILLEEELEHARLYAQIQQTRLQERFLYHEHIEPFFKQCYVPKIILQPFIENSIVHGFTVLHEEKAEVSISLVKLDSYRFKIIIIDNGIGLNTLEDMEDRRIKTSNHVSGTGGYGIKNVKDRLELYLGSEYGLQIENRETRGVKVEITLPYLDSLDKVKRYSTST